MKKTILKLIALACILALVSSFTVSCTERVKINSALKNTSSLQALECDLYWKVNVIDGSQKEEYKIQEKILISGKKILVTSGEYGRDEVKVTYSDGE